MAGVQYKFRIFGIDELNQAITRITYNADDQQELLSVLGGMIESQTRNRIENERTSPDGEGWQDWSEGYAETRHSNHNLLQNEGHLLDSIASFFDENNVEVGTNLIYAASHQFGHSIRNIPPREFLGLSDENLQELKHAIDVWAANLLGQ